MSGLIHQGSALRRISFSGFVDFLSFLCLRDGKAELVWKFEVRVTEVIADHFSRYYRWWIRTGERITVTPSPQTVFTN